ncbi:MAG: ribonucleoside triphosphate reductase [bacterium]
MTKKTALSTKSNITQICKRDGRIVPFHIEKIAEAVFKAIEAAQEIEEEKDQEGAVKLVTENVVQSLRKKFHVRSIPAVEEIQDIVEEELVKANLFKTAKAYIIYREQRSRVREVEHALASPSEMVDKYLNQVDWRVRENSNMGYSLQGLNNHIVSLISSQYWLNRIYPQEVREAHTEGDLHIHDLQLLAAYCGGWDLQDLLIKGFGGNVAGKVQSKPPKHFRTALGQVVNFFYTLQGEAAGAQAFSNFDTLLAPFIRYDGLAFNGVKQCLQEFLFNMNVPTRVGFQTPFTNITMDLVPDKLTGDKSVIIGGQPQKETYKEFQKEMDMLNSAFAEVMLEGDAAGKVFTFPIPTYNITSDFDWDNPVLESVWKMTAKYGIPYFSNFINSDMKPEDARSMCCRLRLDNRELRHRGGGLFSANPLTGSIGVVTINLPRIGYLATTKEDFLKRLAYLMDIAKTSLVIKRKAIEKFTEQGLYPYAKDFLKSIKDTFGQYWRNHFNTIGICGMNETALNFLGKDKNLGTSEGNEFAKEVLEFMRMRLLKYQEEEDSLFNLEATPAESTAYRFAIKDKEKFAGIVCANESAYQEMGADPYYTNSTHLPVNYSDDIFDVLDLQDELQTLYTGGTVLHVFLGEQLPNIEATKALVRRIAENYKLPYYTITPTFSVCPKHGYLSGEKHFCSICDEENGYVEGMVVDEKRQKCEVFSRIVGYLRPVDQWNKGKKAEFKDRRTFDKKVKDISSDTSQKVKKVSVAR